jgi:hypothetical protein
VRDFVESTKCDIPYHRAGVVQFGWTDWDRHGFLSWWCPERRWVDKKAINRSLNLSESSFGKYCEWHDLWFVMPRGWHNISDLQRRVKKWPTDCMHFQARSLHHRFIETTRTK